MFNPAVLTLAREYAGLTKEALAERCEVSRRAVTGWESGAVVAPPTDRLAAVLDVEEERFFDPSPAPIDAEAVSFRALSTLGARKTKAAISAARFGMKWSDWLDVNFDTPNVDVPSLDDLVSPQSSSDVSPGAAARLLRAAWGLEDRPIRHAAELLERHGIRVFGLPRGERDVDAFSFWADGRPFIFLNPDKSGERLRFDLIHELAHLILHKGVATARAKQYEYEANEFASHFLMPADGLLAQVATAARNLDIRDVFTLKKSWRVSAVAMVRRLRHLQLISEWHYNAWMRDLSKQGFRRSEPGGFPAEKSIFLEQVLGRIRARGLTLSMVAREGGVPLRALEDILSGLALLPLRGGDVTTQAAVGASVALGEMSRPQLRLL